MSVEAKTTSVLDKSKLLGFRHIAAFEDSPARLREIDRSLVKCGIDEVPPPRNEQAPPDERLVAQVDRALTKRGPGEVPG